jgi:SNF2 family DNA or RNA helicase
VQALPERRPGTLVSARGREWLVLPGSSREVILARPLGGADDETSALLPVLEPVTDATFDAPSPDDRGDARRARLLRDALRLSFRNTAGPFRSFASLAVQPRNYQLVPLIMSAAQDTTRLLIADGVGVGKTVEAGLIAAELLATGEATRLAVLCSPQLAPQWQEELRGKFGIKAELLLPSTVSRLQRQVPFGRDNLYEHFPYLIISTDFIKQKTRRDEFALHCPELVIVDEAHTCVAGTAVGKSQNHQRYALLRRLADKPDRHLLLLTATPASGDDEAWSNLIGLLDNRLQHLPADLSGPERDADRQLLAKFMIQRQRADIREYLTEDTIFPTRERAEEAYKLTPEYKKLFERVLAYAKESVLDPELDAVRQRVRWWSAIALLRCLASSPAAAASTLRNRSKINGVDTVEQADELATASVLDTDSEDVEAGDDEALGADTALIAGDGTETVDQANRRRLLEFARQAEALQGPVGDAKLKRAITITKKLLADGYMPILFCRYIPTAEYVAKHLTDDLKAVRVESVTGLLPPEEREERVSDLMAHAGPRVLVATDCLSEGVNLQAGFTAVVHYDLAWNPTRHEQREGRVDRFGQTAPIVRAVTYYGEDNGIDGVVLKVLIRRHEAIRKSTGVSVPIPESSTTVMNAIWESLLLNGSEPEQFTFDLGAGFNESPLSADVLTKWENAAEREKASRSRFRQATLRPEVVEETLNEVRAALGGPADVEAFTLNCLTALGVAISTTPDGFTIDTSSLPNALLDQFPPGKRGTLTFVRSLPAPNGTVLLSRTDPTVEAIARYTLDAALDPQLAPEARPARRAGVIRTSAVPSVTALLVVRYRIQLTLPGSAKTIEQVAEDAQFLIHTLDENSGPVWQTDPDLLKTLLAATPTGNVNDDLARQQLEREISRLPAMSAHLQHIGEVLTAGTAEAHKRVRGTTKAGVRGLNAQLLPPPDVLGVYLFLPERSVT